MRKRITLFFGPILALIAFLGWAVIVQAATPTFSLSALDNDNVQVTVNGDADANVLLFYHRADGGSRLQYLGRTNASGYFSQSVSTSNYNIASESVVYVTVNNQSSTQRTWPLGTSGGGTSGALSLSQTGAVMKVGGTTNLSVFNAGSQAIYLLNNSNPQIVNVNINSNTQINLIANAYGQTVVTVCALGTTSNCASVHVTVQNANAQSLIFSQSNLTVAHGQSATVNILSGSGAYSLINNSNPSVIQATLNGTALTISASNNTGTAALTVCAADMSACGIITAGAGTTSSTSLSFSQSAPVVYIGQSQTITISGGSNYNISANSNSNILSAAISGSGLVLNGNTPGTATVTVCASNGNCASLTATVNYGSSGGALTLSQSSIWLQIGQAVSVVVSGGTAPYSLGVASNSGIASANLNNNILTLTGVAAGSGTLDVCSAGGACSSLSILVQGTATNTQLTLSHNNLSLAVGAQTEVSLFGSGGYYISSSNNQHVATVNLEGSKAVVRALAAGSANASICQTGGQCVILYISVSSSTANTPPSFNPNNPEISVGQDLNVNLSGSDSGTYFLSTNSNPTIAQANINGAVLSLRGLVAGSSVLSICSATNNCSSLAVTVRVLGSSDGSGSGNQDSGATTDNVLEIISIESSYISAGNPDIIAANAKIVRSATDESASYTRYVTPLLKNFSLLTAEANTLNYFIWYGTPGSAKLGAGERAGVINSYWQAYKRLPRTEADWSDVLKIAQGRWPSEKNAAAEAQAKIEFRRVYKREARVGDNKDENALTIIAYGLRPAVRNTGSEAVAISTFRSVYGYNPTSPLAWNVVRAIAYSGASR